MMGCWVVGMLGHCSSFFSDVQYDINDKSSVDVMVVLVQPLDFESQTLSPYLKKKKNHNISLCRLQEQY